MPDWVGWLVVLGLGLDTLRRVYGVGRTLNDHLVAAVVMGCMGFYALMHQVSGFAGFLLGPVGIWALFLGLDANRPFLLSPVLGWASQLAYSFALWGGLVWCIHAPWSLLHSDDPWWPGQWLLLALLLSTWGTLQAATRGMVVREHPVRGLPGRLVQLSDLHASAFMHRAQLDLLVDQVNALHPALVVVTGDLVMPFSERDYSYLVEALARLEAPVLCCPGNHDLPVLNPLKEALEAVEVALLVDEQTLQPVENGLFEVTGVNFHWHDARGQFNQFVQQLAPPTRGAFPLLLAHDPRLGRWVPEDRFQLVLSGHTHGGQVACNMFGLPVSVLRLFGVRDQGWFTTGRTRHHVHRGNWLIGLPPRMGVAGEIALFLPEPPAG